MPSKRQKHQAAIKEWQKRQCAFCGNPAGSPEHVLPHWLLKHMKRTPKTILTEEDYKGVKKEHKGQGVEIVTYTVCRDCNTGWMSAIERTSAPTLKNMIDGNSVELKTEDQLLITTWLLKTALVEDTRSENPSQSFTREEREKFREGVKGHLSGPFPSWLSVWVAAYSGDSHLFALAVPGVGKDPGGDPNIPVQFHAFTFAAGHLVLQLLTAPLPFEKDGLRAFERPFDDRFDRAVKRIYPIAPTFVGWPPHEVLGDSSLGLDDLAKRWGRPLPDA